MNLIKSGKIISLMQKSLDCVDNRLNDHGKRVAYLVFKMLKSQNKYNNQQLRDMCILSMIHDIGAYKTDEINKMVEFETTNIWEHSIYGYLFLKYFSPLKEISPVILFHHAGGCQLGNFDSSHYELAKIISFCDRADMFCQSVSNNAEDMKKYFVKCQGFGMSADFVNSFFQLNTKFSLLNEDIENSEEFQQALYSIPLTPAEVNKYLKMTVLSIDFRSNQTVIHTIAATCVAATLAKLANLGEADLDKLTVGAMIHDLGKTGIPIEILEKPDRLTASEMKIMKTHVDITEKIIEGAVDDEIKQIALRHHEKLNGTGYPKGISAKDLSLNERIFAVADIFSALCGVRSYKDAYPREKIVKILTDMSAQNLIDSSIVSLVINNFEHIIEKLNEESQPIIDMYQIIRREYVELLEKVNKNKN